MRGPTIRIIAAGIILIGLTQLFGCNSQETWKEAQKTDTYKSYQQYINDNPNGNHLSEAKKRADQHYWKSIKNDSTAKSFQQYLKLFPQGQFRSQAQAKIHRLTHHGLAAKARVTGSGVIIRSDHTTSSLSKGVVAKKGTVVQLLGQYESNKGNGAILKHETTVVVHGKHIKLAKGKAIHILGRRGDSVKASFITNEFGSSEGLISKDDIQAMSGQKWYKIRTTDGITGWLYGKYIKEMN
jgi:hypothetical protein